VCAGIRCRIQRAGNQPVAPLLLHSGQPAEEFVGDVLAQSDAPKAGTRDLQPFAPQLASAVGGLASILPHQLEARDRYVVNPAEVVIEARDLEPVAVGIDDSPPGQIVDGRSPQHRFLAARVHRDIASDARGVGRGRIDREHATASLGGLRYAACHDTGLGQHGRHRPLQTGKLEQFDAAAALQLLGVDHRRQFGQRNRASGIAGSASPRHDGQPQLGAGPHQARYFILGVRA